jgi:hypothetical protein
MLACVFGFKPDFIGADVYQAFGVTFESQRFDVNVFNVFFALGLLEFGVQIGCGHAVFD